MNNHIDNIKANRTPSFLSQREKNLWEFGYIKALEETRKDLNEDFNRNPTRILLKVEDRIKEAIKFVEEGK